MCSCTVRVTIFSNSSIIQTGLKFTGLHALTLAARSSALLMHDVNVHLVGQGKGTVHGVQTSQCRICQRGWNTKLHKVKKSIQKNTYAKSILSVSPFLPTKVDTDIESLKAACSMSSCPPLLHPPPIPLLSELPSELPL